MIKRVLVVGGAGYIGGCVTDQLLVKKIPFAVYDNLTYENHYLKPVEFIFGDIRDHRMLKKILQGFSHIIWLAAIVGDGACAIKPELTQEINERSVKWISQNFKKRIVFTSTCSVYGLNTNIVSESSSTNPLSVYAKTKLVAERHLTHSNALIFRIGTAYGVGDNFSRIRMDLAINYMTMYAVKYKNLIVNGGNQWRPFIHVRDIGKAIVENLDRSHTGIYNIATQNLTIKDVGRMIQTETRCRILTKKQEIQDDRNYRVDTTKSIKNGILSIKPTNTVTDGIKEIRSLVLSNRIKNLDHEFYSNQKYLLRAIESYEKIFIQ